VQTITGRKIIIENINSSDFKLRKAAERASQNYPMQGSAADIVKKAMVDLADAFNSRGISASIIMQVHDELVIEFPKEFAKECVEMMNRKMSEAIKLSVPMTVDIGMSTNWEQCHTIGEISKENIELSQSAMS
jgi:DNA polymerase-1